MSSSGVRAFRRLVVFLRPMALDKLKLPVGISFSPDSVSTIVISHLRPERSSWNRSSVIARCMSSHV